jgi:hypothetical protein
MVLLFIHVLLISTALFRQTVTFCLRTQYSNLYANNSNRSGEVNEKSQKDFSWVMKKQPSYILKNVVSGARCHQIGHAMPVKSKMTQNIIFAKFGHKVMTVFQQLSH